VDTANGRANALLSDEAMLEALIQEAPMPFAFYDDHLRYQRVNQALADINGTSIQEHLGRLPTEVLPADLGLAVEDMLRHVMAVGRPVADPDFTSVGPDGVLRHWQSSWFPVRDTHGFVAGVAVLVTDVTERRRVEEALRRSQERTARLQQATARLAGALTVDDVVDVVSQVGIDTVGADWSGVVLLDRHEVLRFVTSAPSTRGPGKTHAGAELPTELRAPATSAVLARIPVYVDSPGQLRRQFPLDPPYPVPGVDDWSPNAEVDSQSSDNTSDGRAWAVLPLLTAEEPLGALLFAFGRPRRLDRHDRTFLEALSGQCALVIERSKLFEREHNTAVALQRSLLPDRLPDVPGIQLASRYLPGTAEAEVGGDWYDAFILPHGRLAFVVGDVMGKGLAAAAGMGRVRSALRAFAFADPSPAAVIGGLDRLFAATEPPEHLVTLVYGTVDPQTGDVELSSAGHLPLLYWPMEGLPVLVDLLAGSTPLGVPEPRIQRTLRISPGDVLVGFSDGLVENRGRPVGDGLDAVITELTRPGDSGCDPKPGGLDALLERLLARLLAGQQRDDDVTLLGLRMTQRL
jgi:PAS domain S-box-containing protein